MHSFKMGQARYGLYEAFLCEQTNRSMPFFFYCYPLHNYRYLPFCLIVITTTKIVERATFLTSSPPQRLLLYTTTYLSHPVLHQVYLSVSPCPVLIWSSCMSHPVTGSSLPVSSFPASGLPTCLIPSLSGLPICLNVSCIWSTRLSYQVLYLVYPTVSSCPVFASARPTHLSHLVLYLVYPPVSSCLYLVYAPISSCPVSGLPTCLILSCIWSIHLSHLVLSLHGQPTCLILRCLCMVNHPVSTCPVSA